ncbi:MAG: hypothetical protein WKG01_16055 [Kofleriaceae bacterium]
MTVTRYRDVADMPAPPAREPQDPTTYARIRDLWQFSSRLVPALYPPGVYRYRSVEDSNVARERATIDRMRIIRAARVR